MVHRLVPALVLLVTLAGCLGTGGALGPIVSGGKHDVSAVRLSLPPAGGGSVAVSVIDQRPYVVAGKESTEFLGTERAAWSQTVSVKTASGRSLAEDLTTVIADALVRAGAQATPLPLPRGTAEPEALTQFRSSGADRLLAVQIREWRTDSYTRVIMKWNLEAVVYDATGAVLGRSRASGNTPVGDTTATADSNQMTQRELARQLTNLLDVPAITGALR